MNWDEFIWDMLRLLCVAALCVGVVIWIRTQPVEASSYASCRSMDAFPVMTPDSGVACVTQAVLVADTIPQEDSIEQD